MREGFFKAVKWFSRLWEEAHSKPSITRVVFFILNGAIIYRIVIGEEVGWATLAYAAALGGVKVANRFAENKPQ